MDMARERISLILELMAMFLSFQMTFSLVTAAVVWAILGSTSGLDTTAPRYLKLRTVSIILRSMVMSVLTLVLFVINLVFSALIHMQYAMEASNLGHCCYRKANVRVNYFSSRVIGDK